MARRCCSCRRRGAGARGAVPRRACQVVRSHHPLPARLRPLDPAGLDHRSRRHRPYHARSRRRSRAEEYSGRWLLLRRLDRRRDGDQGRRFHLQAGAGRSPMASRPASRPTATSPISGCSTPMRSWHANGMTPTEGKRDFTAMPEDELAIVARDRESFARFGWEPYLHNPKLKYRLHRIRVPTLLIWGANDGIVTPQYGEAYRKLIPGRPPRHHPAGRPPAPYRAAAGISRGTRANFSVKIGRTSKDEQHESLALHGNAISGSPAAGDDARTRG